MGLCFFRIMTKIEEIVRKLIAAAEKERSEIVELINASPLIGIIEGREKAQEILSKYEIGDPRLAEEISALAVEEKRLFDIAEKKKDSIALIERRVKLEMELTSLHGELYWIERRNSVLLAT